METRAPYHAKPYHPGPYPGPELGDYVETDPVIWAIRIKRPGMEVWQFYHSSGECVSSLQDATRLHMRSAAAIAGQLVKENEGTLVQVVDATGWEN